MNPYLYFAAVLGAALDGMEREANPPDPVAGSAYDRDLPKLPMRWDDAIATFEASPLKPPGSLRLQLIENLLWTKRQEAKKSAAMEPADLLRFIAGAGLETSRALLGRGAAIIGPWGHFMDRA